MESTRNWNYLWLNHIVTSTLSLLKETEYNIGQISSALVTINAQLLGSKFKHFLGVI